MPPVADTSSVPRMLGVTSVVVAAGIISSIQLGKTSIATPMLQLGLGLDLTATGWLTGIFAIIGVVGGVPAGAWVSQTGDRRILCIGLGLLGAGTIIGATAPGFRVLLIARVLEGVGFLFVAVAGPAVLNRVVRADKRSSALALWSCFMPVGLALAMLIGPMFSDWRSFWWSNVALLLLSFAATLAVVPALPRNLSSRMEGVAHDALRVLREWQSMLLASCFTFYSLMFFALFGFLPVLLMQQMGLEHSTAGLISAFVSGVNVIGNLGAGYLLARGVHRRLLLASSFLIMGLVSIGIFLELLGPVPVFLLCVLFSAAGGVIPATLISSAPLLAPSTALAPVLIGLLMQGSNLGQIIGPTSMGVAIGAYGWVSASVIVPCVALSAAFSALAIRFDDRREAMQNVADSSGAERLKERSF